jgi:protein-arginine kinase activator protein McsA
MKCEQCRKDGVTLLDMVLHGTLRQHVCRKCASGLEGAWQQWGRYIPAKGARG